MRITHRSLADSTYANLQSSLARTARLQEQLSSGRQISRPSDSPSGTTSALQLTTGLRNAEQYARNADAGLGWLQSADTALQQAATTLRRVRDLAVQAGNESLGQVGRDAVAAEVVELRGTLLSLANTQVLGRPIFGGTTAGDQAFDATGTYVGDGGQVARRVAAGVQVRVDVDGQAVFGSGPGSVFDHLDTMVTTLQGGGATSASIADVDVSLDRVLGALSDIGARYGRVERLRQVAEDSTITLRSSLSEVVDIDLPRTILELQLQETAYEASLGATARVIQPSLLDFLR